ncbi:hypothetical protein CLG96_14560 [Sphingomonas oleivorans]|uniref:Uncharacterized protein n=1 Tax=Sphingomonas oleivorans TaxID=1735121 RepID=A0A2T5FVE8_9SPHN|nr:hypothetical protein CLG96_14560 [Sphingomonas oleivorans]
MCRGRRDIGIMPGNDRGGRASRGDGSMGRTCDRSSDSGRTDTAAHPPIFGRAGQMACRLR